MENKAHALIAGMFTVILAIAAIGAAIWFNGDRSTRIPYELITRQSIPGLNLQAAVRYRGLEVGKVEAIGFDPKTPGQIVVRISVKPDTPITLSTFATLGYQGVTGIAYVELDDDGSKPTLITSNAQHIAQIEMRPSLFDTLQLRGLAILEKTETLTQRFNALLAPDNQKAIMQAVDRVSSAANQIETIPRQLQPTIDQLPALTQQASHTLESVNKLAQETSTLSANINSLTSRLQAKDSTIDKLNLAIEHVGSAADKIEREAIPLTQEIRSSLRTIDRTLDRVSDRPQSLLFGSRATPGPGEAGFKDGK